MGAAPTHKSASDLFFNTLPSATTLPLTPTLQDDLVFLRARTKRHEIMVAPGEGYVLVVCSRAFPPLIPSPAYHYHLIFTLSSLNVHVPPHRCFKKLNEERAFFFVCVALRPQNIYDNYERLDLRVTLHCFQSIPARG